MKRILAFGASNSKNSINKAFAGYAGYQIENTEFDLIDLNDFEMPIYSIDRERESGIPEAAFKFKDHVNLADAIIISFAEHNGHYTVAFKNIFDWVSRIDRDIWLGRPMFLLSTSPGQRGGKRVLDHAITDMGRKNGNVAAYFSLPSFWQNFSSTEGIKDKPLMIAFKAQLNLFEKAMSVSGSPITL